MKLFHSKIPSAQFEKIANVLESGILGFGPNVPEFERQFASYSTKTNNIAVNSASAAAFLIFAYLKETHGVCNIYTTPLGFTSPAWAAKHFGHNLVFVDLNEQLLMDPDDYKHKRIHTPNIAKNVVMPVLYGGVSTIEDWVLFGDEIVVTDSAHCATPTLRSHFTFFSFHPYKPICTSDGGMISTDNNEATEYFRSYRNFGRQAQASSYDLTQDGFKFYMNNLNATLGLISLEQYEEDLAQRKWNLKFITAGCPNTQFLNHDDQSSYYFATAIDENADRKLEELGIQRNYPLLHKTTYFADGTTLPHAEAIHNKILNIPIHQHLTSHELTTIVEVING